MSCAHENFSVQARIGRLTVTEGGPVTYYTAEIEIRCSACGLQFEFVGLPVGSSPYRPTVGVGATELRAPIMPPGMKPPEGLPSFSVRMSEDADQ